MLNLNLIEVLVNDAIQGNWYLELPLESGKSYVGLPLLTGYVESPEAGDVELIPLFSCYRTHETR